MLGGIARICQGAHVPATEYGATDCGYVATRVDQRHVVSLMRSCDVWRIHGAAVADSQARSLGLTRVHSVYLVRPMQLSAAIPLVVSPISDPHQVGSAGLAF